VSVPLTVTFYSDSALTQVIGSVVVADDVPGCARRRLPVSVVWPDLGTGLHQFWVKVDSSNVVGETSEDDNVMQGLAFVGTHGVYLPLIERGFP
jgi:hypothetical protein